MNVDKSIWRKSNGSTHQWRKPHLVEEDNQFSRKCYKHASYSNIQTVSVLIPVHHRFRTPFCWNALRCSKIWTKITLRLCTNYIFSLAVLKKESLHPPSSVFLCPCLAFRSHEIQVSLPEGSYTCWCIICRMKSFNYMIACILLGKRWCIESWEHSWKWLWWVTITSLVKLYPDSMGDWMTI